MATLSELAVSNLALKGAGTVYNYVNRFFQTKAEADAALADSSWVPLAGKFNACLTGDQGLLVYNETTSSLDVADGATRAYIDSQISSLVDGSPETLDTLNELAAALNDDPAYFTNAEAARQANTNLINAETARATAAEAAIQSDVDQNEADADAAIAAVQADVDQNEADADAAIAALQADVDQNEADADAAIAAENAAMLAAVSAVQSDVDQNEADADAAIAAENAAMLAAVSAVQADVDQNEADADAAIAAVQADVDANEADRKTYFKWESNLTKVVNPLRSSEIEIGNNIHIDPAAGYATQFDGNVQFDNNTTLSHGGTDLTATFAELNFVGGVTSNIQTQLDAIQADVDQNELVADAAIAGVQADVDQNEADADAAIAALQADVDQNEADADAALALKAPLESPALTGTPTAPTAAQASGTTQIATTAYVDTAVANLIDTAPGALDTLNELAAAIADDANFSTTITNSITAVQNDVNQNEVDSDAADAALSGRLDVLEADPTTAAAVAAVQADVDQNEADSDAAEAALSGRLDVLEADPTTATAVAAVQADVDQNEADADAAIAVERGRIDAVETEIDTARTNIYTAIGQSEGAQSMGTFTGSTLGDNQNIKQLLQTLETTTEGEISARTAIAEFVSNLTRLKNDLRGTYINVGNNIELRPAPGGRVEIVGDLYLDNNTAIDGNGTILTSFANINAYDGRLNVLEADPTTATAVAAVQADVDQNEADADAAIAAVQADVDQNEADADAAIALKADIASPTFTGTPAAPTASAGTNTTQLATTAFVSTAVANLVDGAPGAIDTLNELAAALGDDANFATTVTNSIAAVQADVDQNEVDSDAAEAALSGRLDVLEADPTTATAVAAVQADVDQNEADADAAIAAVQADVDQNEADADAAIAAVQADVDQNEADADAAIAAVQADVDQNEADADAAIAANEVHIDNLVALTGVSKDATNLGTFSGTTISDSRTLKLALQDLETSLENKANISFVQNEIADVIDGAPGALNTLNEIAAAMNDDENLSVTLTNLINANETHVDNMATLTGVAKDSTNLGTFTGGTINDNQTIKQALQALETQVEATQADVDQNEVDSDAAESALSGRLDVLEADPTTATAVAAVQADVDQNEADADAAIALKADIASPTFTGTPAAPTASAGTNTTQLATTAFVATAVANLVDGAPGAIDTLNELAAALGDDSDFATTITNSIAAVQSDVDQNEVDGDAADSALSGRLDVLEADPTTATAVAAVQADVDQNEADADAAIALKLDASAVSAFGLTLVDDADAAAARTTLGVDVAGTDNSTDVTIAVGRDYISITGQELTLGAVDLAADVTGTLPVANGGTGATDVAGIKSSLDIDHIHTTIGVAANADDLGTFTGTTIDDNVTIKAALQALETAQETTQADVDQNESDADTAIANILNGTSIPGPYNNDIDAAAGGVAVGAIFKNSNGTIHWRVS